MNRLRRGLSPCWEVQLLWLGADAILRGYVITVCCSLALAGVVGFGADSRFRGPGFATVQLTGGHIAWGVLFALIAAALVIAPRMSMAAVRWALWAAGTLHLLFAIGFLVAAANSPLTPFTGPVAYGAIALWHVSQAESYRVKPVRLRTGETA